MTYRDRFLNACTDEQFITAMENIDNLLSIRVIREVLRCDLMTGRICRSQLQCWARSVR